MIEKDFVQEGLRRTRIDEYLEKEGSSNYTFRYYGYCLRRKTWYGNW